MDRIGKWIAGFCLLSSVAPLSAAPPKFTPVELETNFCQIACYAVTTADVDGDGKLDIVAVTENKVLWYQAPDWKRHVVIEDQTERDNVCIAPFDIDDDGKIDFALGAGWTKNGSIHWLKRGATLDEKWSVHPIGREGWTHRMRFANVLNKARPQLVVSPLNATEAKGVRLTAFEIPSNPESNPWPRVVLDDTLNRMHNHWHVDFKQEGHFVTLAASQEGVHLIRQNENQTFTRRRVAAGATGAKPESSGTGEVKVGKLKNGQPFMATIEPMHGQTVAVYTAPPNLPEGTLADRLVIDDTYNQGHALWVADLDGDGDDEIVAGFREPGSGAMKGPGLYIYESQDAEGKQWTKSVLDDGGIAVEDVVCADLNGDGRIDIVAGGRATKNLKLYLNAGQ